MDDQEFRKLLKQLQKELAKTKSVDEKGRELLRKLGSDIDELLERTEPPHPAKPPASVVQRLNDAVDHFEVTHPELTTMLSEMLNILNNAGI